VNKHFVLMSLESHEKNLTERLRRSLDRAIDWTEITPNSWLLWTSTSSNGWLKRLKASDISFKNALIIEVNPADRAGVMPDEVWKFIRRREPNHSAAPSDEAARSTTA
jgi:hypothetical protein